MENQAVIISRRSQRHESYLDSFPPGYRFCPYDEELIQHYLRKKLNNLTLPHNRIHEVNIYKYHPDQLAEKYEAQGVKEWYFFTPRERKYPKGKRPSRSAIDGYWKATSGDKVVKFNGRIVGYKKTLVFFQGKSQKAGNKTSWIMQEYFAVDAPSNTQRDQNDTKLDDLVLCKIYKKEYKQAGLRDGQVLVDDGNSIVVTSEGTNYMQNITETETELTGQVLDDGINDDDIMQSSAGKYSTALVAYEGTNLMHNITESEPIEMDMEMDMVTNQYSGNMANLNPNGTNVNDDIDQQPPIMRSSAENSTAVTYEETSMLGGAGNSTAVTYEETSIIGHHHHHHHHHQDRQVLCNWINEMDTADHYSGNMATNFSDPYQLLQNGFTEVLQYSLINDQQDSMEPELSDFSSLWGPY